ncbi:MAG: phosphoglycerate kinase [Candidatus Buchananbacteria bacterium RIFCSPLOWO2_01_FULL_56_15]|uniref:Phosphoglycerate kinase n=1 Tax=Candidatus Buchananbacteria bacterium RIFCSPLOWO2_01_FULL_56_15 TaxID=1797547 RepID=A0A1G1YR67_9BACT|nr:MAG: phosphoglycerate kinase [Candidatus Buchananbacteria bacterium RIFCSPLOWO2_01_FULL_56_15]
MKLKSIKSVGHLRGKRVLFRVAYDVPLVQRGKRWAVADDRRIAGTLPTLRYLLRQQCRVVILSWLKRPGGRVVADYRMDPVARCLSKLINQPVKKLDDCIGPKVFREINELKPGGVLMLENVRFYHQEEENNKRFARLLVHGIDLIVFDAFGQAHRVHASTTGITALRPTYAGLLLERELAALGRVAQRPSQPLIVVLGGAKISDKVAVIEHLVKIADQILIGGGLANVFLKATGVPIGRSFVEDTFVDKAKRTSVNAVKVARQLYQRYRSKITLPVDLVAASSISPHALVEVVDLAAHGRIDPRWKFLDIGPKTTSEFTGQLKRAKTIFWNGPMGVFEIGKFDAGTKMIAQAIAASRATSVVGGGDTEQAVARYRLAGSFTHVSTGGGASLEFLAGRPLPALKHIIHLL